MEKVGWKNGRVKINVGKSCERICKTVVHLVIQKIDQNFQTDVSLPDTAHAFTLGKSRIKT